MSENDVVLSRRDRKGTRQDISKAVMDTPTSSPPVLVPARSGIRSVKETDAYVKTLSDFNRRGQHSMGVMDPWCFHSVQDTNAWVTMLRKGQQGVGV